MLQGRFHNNPEPPTDRREVGTRCKQLRDEWILHKYTASNQYIELATTSNRNSFWLIISIKQWYKGPLHANVNRGKRKQTINKGLNVEWTTAVVNTFQRVGGYRQNTRSCSKRKWKNSHVTRVRPSAYFWLHKGSQPPALWAISIF